MLFGLFSKKDHRHYLTLGGKHLAAERFADARIDFEEALKLCPADAAQDEREIRDGLQAAANGLGTLNLHEGERSMNAGDLEKAVDHFTLACELAFDETIKAMARQQLRRLQGEPEISAAPAAANAAKAAPAGPYAAYATASSSTSAQAARAAVAGQSEAHAHAHAHSHSHGGGCGGSCGGGHMVEIDDEDSGSHLSEEDRFQLLISPLGADLAARYAALGERFQHAYLLIQDGNDAKALPILQELAVSCENDVVIYELALIMYRSGRVHECETHLKRSLALNDGNAMTYIALVHLLAEKGRLPEALEVVGRMLELNVVPDQALIMQGDIYQGLGDQATAMESWTKALNQPSVARGAAERLIPILDAQGRQKEAKFLAKQYLKGCH